MWTRPEDIGQTLRVRVTVTNRIGSFTATSAPSAQIEQAPVPEVVEPPVLSPNAWGTPTVGADPRVGELVWAHIDDVFSEGLAHAETRYRWQRCSADGLECEDVPGTVNSAGYKPRRRDIGFRLRVRVVAIAGHGEAWALSGLSGVIRDGDPQNTDRPRIVGAPRVREYLRASTGTWDPNPWWSEVQWLRCDEHGRDCTEIPDADWEEYLTDNDDLGSTLRVRVRAVTGDGSTTALSPPTAPIGPPGAPENVELPSIWGDPIAGGWLYGLEGSWRGAEPLDFDVRWFRCDPQGEDCVLINGVVD